MEQIQFKDMCIWHNKADLDIYVAKKLQLTTPSRGDKLYDDIMHVISDLRRIGILVDWNRNSNDVAMGIWRLQDSEKYSDEIDNTDRHGRDIKTISYSRSNQDKFRYNLNRQYNYKCILCGFNLPKYLIAAHIVPYNRMKVEDNEHAMDLHNGLLLCRLCDKAFEDHDIIIEPDLTVNKTKLEKKITEMNSVRNWLESIIDHIDISNVKYPPSSKYLEQKKRESSVE